MVINKIELKFEKSATCLTGFSYGLSVFNEQVKEKIDFNIKTTIIFPNEIKRVASSFVQGFFSDIINKIGYSAFDEKIIIETESDTLNKRIREDLF